MKEITITKLYSEKKRNLIKNIFIFKKKIKNIFGFLVLSFAGHLIPSKNSKQ